MAEKQTTISTGGEEWT